MSSTSTSSRTGRRIGWRESGIGWCVWGQHWLPGATGSSWPWQWRACWRPWLPGMLPAFGLWFPLAGVLPAPQGGRLLTAHAAEPARLVPPIQMTILAAHLQPVILAGVLFWSGR